MVGVGFRFSETQPYVVEMYAKREARRLPFCLLFEIASSRVFLAMTDRTVCYCEYICFAQGKLREAIFVFEIPVH